MSTRVGPRDFSVMTRCVGTLIIPESTGSTPPSHLATPQTPRLCRGPGLPPRSIRFWKPPSSSSPSLEVAHTSPTLRLACRSSVLRVVRHHPGTNHERQPLEVGRHPRISPRQEGQTLLISCPEDHDGPAGPHSLDHDLPQSLPDTCAEVTHEYARRYLQQPPRNVPAQPVRNSRENQHHHQTSPVSIGDSRFHGTDEIVP